MSLDQTEKIFKKENEKLTNYPILDKLRQHHEIIAAITSGVIILIIWLFRSSIEPNHPGWWAGLHILAFIIGGYAQAKEGITDRKSTRLNSSHVAISYAVFCLKK